MRLFPKVAGTVDRYERAGLLTMPFDLAFGAATDPPEAIFFTNVTLSLPTFSSVTLSLPSFTEVTLESSDGD